MKMNFQVKPRLAMAQEVTMGLITAPLLKNTWARLIYRLDWPGKASDKAEEEQVWDKLKPIPMMKTPTKKA